MSADLSAKGKSTLDQLEDTRTEMRQMQSNFSEQEAQWREKNGCLQVELQNSQQKLESLEESFGRMEKVRFELSTKNAELQEKVVQLQTSLSEVKAAKEEESIANFHFEEKMKGKIDALERTIEASEMTRNNRKQDFIESIKDIGNLITLICPKNFNEFSPDFFPDFFPVFSLIFFPVFSLIFF